MVEEIISEEDLPNTQFRKPMTPYEEGENCGKWAAKEAEKIEQDVQFVNVERKRVEECTTKRTWWEEWKSIKAEKVSQRQLIECMEGTRRIGGEGFQDNSIIENNKKQMEISLTLE